MLAIVLVALSLGLSNLAASIGIGAAGVDGRTRLRVGLAFGVFETGMPLVGLALGHGLAGHLGGAGRWAGAALLIAVGGWTCIAALRAPGTSGDHEPGDGGAASAVAASGHGGRLVLLAAALSIDNLAAGFALGAYRVNFVAAAVIIGAVSAGLSLAGLELGHRLSGLAGRHGELIGGVVLIGVGAAIAAGLL